MPLKEGLWYVRNFLVGAGLKNRNIDDDIKIIASGKVSSGFSLVKTLAAGADLTNSARAMMFALGCIQALKCNTNKCPTGITSQDPRLINGLVVEDKVERVFNYHYNTIQTVAEIIGAAGVN